MKNKLHKKAIIVPSILLLLVISILLLLFLTTRKGDTVPRSSTEQGQITIDISANDVEYIEYGISQLATTYKITDREQISSFASLINGNSMQLAGDLNSDNDQITGSLVFNVSLHDEKTVLFSIGSKLPLKDNDIRAGISGTYYIFTSDTTEVESAMNRMIKQFWEYKETK